MSFFLYTVVVKFVGIVWPWGPLQSAVCDSRWAFFFSPSGRPLARQSSAPCSRLNEHMWAALAKGEGVPPVLITLTWIRWRQPILQTVGDQSKPTWNMPPATFTLGSMLFKVEHFHLCLWLFCRQSWSPHGALRCQMIPPPPPPTTSPLTTQPLFVSSTLKSRSKVKGWWEKGLRFTLSCL